MHDPPGAPAQAASNASYAKLYDSAQMVSANRLAHLSALTKELQADNNKLRRALKQRHTQTTDQSRELESVRAAVCCLLPAAACLRSAAVWRWRAGWIDSWWPRRSGASGSTVAAATTNSSLDWLTSTKPSW